MLCVAISAPGKSFDNILLCDVTSFMCILHVSHLKVCKRLSVNNLYFYIRSMQALKLHSEHNSVRTVPLGKLKRTIYLNDIVWYSNDIL